MGGVAGAAMTFDLCFDGGGGEGDVAGDPSLVSDTGRILLRGFMEVGPNGRDDAAICDDVV